MIENEKTIEFSLSKKKQIHQKPFIQDFLYTNKIINMDNMDNNNVSKKTYQKNINRLCTEKQKWKKYIYPDLLQSSTNQFELLKNSNANTNIVSDIMKSQIILKLYGYKTQDIEKGIYDESKFIDFDTIREKLIECQMSCFYCKKNIFILYEKVREKLQWSVDRIDNTYGHNIDNIVISCLECNLHRRCRKSDEFLFTSEIKIYKQSL